MCWQIQCNRNRLNRLTCLAERKLHSVLTNAVAEINVMVNKYPGIKMHVMIWDRTYVSRI